MYGDIDVQDVLFVDYVLCMKFEQSKIYYVIVDIWQVVKNSLYFEVFCKKGVEVLLLIDCVDEWMLLFLYEFDGKLFVSVVCGDFDFGELNDEEKKVQEQVGEVIKLVVEKMKEVFGDKVKEVCVMFCLIDLLLCFVVDDNDMSGYLQWMLKVVGQNVLVMQLIFEINFEYVFVKQLNVDSVDFGDWCYLLFDQVLLVEGGMFDDLVSFVKWINVLLLLCVV